MISNILLKIIIRLKRELYINFILKNNDTYCRGKIYVFILPSPNKITMAIEEIKNDTHIIDFIVKRAVRDSTAKEYKKE